MSRLLNRTFTDTLLMHTLCSRFGAPLEVMQFRSLNRAGSLGCSSLFGLVALFSLALLSMGSASFAFGSLDSFMVG